MKDRILTVDIEGDELVIRIGIETLAFATENCSLDYFSDEKYENIFTVTDKEEWAKSVVDALSNEEEDGTTIVHEMFEKAFDFAVQQGFLGIEEKE